MSDDFMPSATLKLPLGGPAWLRAMADEKEKMAHALPSETEWSKREDEREIQGLRDAANRMHRIETALENLVKACVPQGSQLALLGVKAPPRAVWLAAKRELEA